MNSRSHHRAVTHASNEETPSQDELVIRPDLCPCITYASWQNSTPMIRGLELFNSGDDCLLDGVLRVSSSPEFARPKQWVIDRLEAGSTVSVRDADVELDPKFLQGLNEATRGELTFELTSGDKVISQRVSQIELLARDEWGGIEQMGELLSAFVLPNDPCVSGILKDASDVLQRNRLSPSLDGYQSGDPKRVYALISALWSAIASRELTYANPPKSFEQRGQKVRRPETVLRDGLATCLDSSLLFAACAEAIGLHAVVVFKHGHCFPGVWLVENCFGRLIESDCTEVRKAVTSNELVVFESTLVTRRPASSFQDAVETATRALSEKEEGAFVAAIDVERARMVRVRPLASHSDADRDEVKPEDDTAEVAFTHASTYEVDTPALLAEKPMTPTGRIDRWHRKLLDLTLRNRLLNFRETKQTVPFLCPTISLLEDRLAEGKRFKLVSLPDANVGAGRDTEHHEASTHENLEWEYATEALSRTELCATIDGKELQHRLTKLYRSVRNDMAEGGSNTLYLAVGFLRWKDDAHENRTFRAPLLLVPVKLLRRNAKSAYRLAHHEDDVRFNATLIQKLKRDYDCDLSVLESDLPTDDNGIDVPAVLRHVRHVVRSIPGFEVIDETALARFSFAKYLMWKDLVDRSDQLETNRVVRHLVHDPEKPFRPEVTSAIPDTAEMDRRYEPHELMHPLPADSSQLAAVMAAAEGHDFVLVGPPGTGKSQTISNMIAQCLAKEKTVLFVAEKTAALDVVHRRLCEVGLGDVCLELHSNKAERRKFLDQLDRAWAGAHPDKEIDWVAVNDQLKSRRDHLNGYVEALHDTATHGGTPYQAMGLSVAGTADPTPQLDWPAGTEHTRRQLSELTDIVSDVATTYASVERVTPLPSVTRTEWSAGWERMLVSVAGSLENICAETTAALDEAASATSLPLADGNAGLLHTLRELLGQALDDTSLEMRTFSQHPDLDQLPRAAKSLAAAIKQFDGAAKQIDATFEDDELRRIPLEDLDRRWREAGTSMWPFRFFAKRKVEKLLQTYAARGKVDAARDMPRLRDMQSALKDIDGNPLAGADHSRWNHRATDADRLLEDLLASLKLRDNLRQVIQSYGGDAAQPDSAWRALLTEPCSETVRVKVKSLCDKLAAFEAVATEFGKLAGSRPYKADSRSVLSDSRKTAEHVQTHRKTLPKWTAWQGVRQRALAEGLEHVIGHVESGEFALDELVDRFKLAYARWWLPDAIDGSEPLRQFRSHQHEQTIREFCRFDDDARAGAVARVLASVSHRLPPKSDVARKSELGMLRHQIGLKRPSKSIREVISGMPENFSKLSPCLLMSPLSIAQYLPPDHPPFDVVIFDEASQITTWDAIGAIARGRQTVIVGDPKQLPPTNFFGVVEDDEDDESLEDHEKDLESILDEATASGLPTFQLRWHYRSRSESLIAFSNHHYYNDQLVTFPSPETNDRAVHLRLLPDADYDRGKTRTNLAEAQAVVDESVRRMTEWLELPEEERPTLGVVTFNLQQQSLIEDLFDGALREHPSLEWFFSEDRIEPTVVKNLENVQGDERDVMLFSITFGPRSDGTVPLTFGALNLDGGHRRLNVAVTRARRELMVFCSFTADQLATSDNSARGVRDLKQFLAFAEKGAGVLERSEETENQSFVSPFESAVASGLRSRGWEVAIKVGVAGHRIDLAVVHPSRPNEYLAGIACDGESYARSATACDRDKTRPLVTEGLGWRMLRVWSRQWWYDPEGTLDEIDGRLRSLSDSKNA